LAVYLAGIVIGNSRLVFQRGIFLFHDASAWLSQIIMFVVLGLLSFPSRLLEVGWHALLIAVVLTVIARPLSVVLILFPFRFSWREQLVLSWGGLKGAVPITLATFPLLFDLPRASLIFDVVFFVVLLSALVQGWTLPFVARRLGLELPAPPTPPVTLEISSLRHVEGDIVDYRVDSDSRAAGRRVKELALPAGVVIALIARSEQIIPPQGHTRIEAGDHVIVVLRPGTRPLVNRVFARVVSPRDELPQLLEFPLRGSIRVGELEEFYGIKMNSPASITLDDAIRERYGSRPVQLDGIVRFGAIALHVRELDPDGKVSQVGMVILPQHEIPSGAAPDTRDFVHDSVSPSSASQPRDDT
jgi:cell volume regulation protein A